MLGWFSFVSFSEVSSLEALMAAAAVVQDYDVML